MSDIILLLAVDHIVQSVDMGQAVCVSFLDLRKAFDSLDHCILLQRICDLGVSSQVLLWFKNYLSGRVHRVKAGDRYSDWGSMCAGIPQGSALGPLLFLIYVNSLPSQVTAGLLLQYADDTALMCSGTSPQDAADVMNQQLQLVYDWIVSSNYKMQLNFQKSKVMWFSASPKKLVSSPKVEVDNIILEVVDTQLYLGLVFDSKLSWEGQVSNVCKKMSYYIYLLNYQKHVLSDGLKRPLVDSLVSSHLTYALCVWGP